MIPTLYGRAVAEEAERLRRDMITNFAVRGGKMMLLLGPDEHQARIKHCALEMPLGYFFSDRMHYEYRGMQVLVTREPTVKVVWAP